MPFRILLAIAVTELDARQTLGARAQQLCAGTARATGHADDTGAGSLSRGQGLSAPGATAGRLMLDRTGKPTPRLRASVLREEGLEGRLQRLKELEHWIKRALARTTVSACAPMQSAWRSTMCGKRWTLSS